MYQFVVCSNKGETMLKNCKFVYFCHLKKFVSPEPLDPTTYMCVICTQACMCRCEGCACVNYWLRKWIFHTSSVQVLLPVQFSNSLLLYRHTFFHAVCPVVLPEERLLVVCKSQFPYLHYRLFSPIIIISSEFPWLLQDNCKSNRTTTYVFATANIHFLTYCIHLCVLTA